ncbi:adenylate/guanylate cyclase domain-containing protein [Tsukamurella soli]|uniref:Adenylate cyclase n=1 Tax=Tsukamurella soli TaxID=644556 RepID=A0ABP8KDW6_9ACTN
MLERPPCVSDLADPRRKPSDGRAPRLRMLTAAALTAAAVFAVFGVLQLVVGRGFWYIGFVNIAAAALFVLVPRLYRLGELVAPWTFIAVAYGSLTLVCAVVGTGAGLQLYFLAAAACGVVVLGIERGRDAVSAAALGIALLITLQLTVPNDTGTQPAWMLTVSFVVNAIVAGGLAVGIVWFGLRQVAAAEADLERQYERSEALLNNILPSGVVDRLKASGGAVIADRYDDASVLMADIAGYTERASGETATELVAFLNELYGRLDALVAQHGLEKIKTSGDSYMVVSGVPQPRPDHLAAMAGLALALADTVAEFRDPAGAPVPLRIGVASGPVVAGVIGTQRFFYDVWGDAVNVASRMESTAPVGRIQVPSGVAEQLQSDFVLEDRGLVDVKGKGVMHTWFLVARVPGQRSSSRAR